LTRGSTDTEIFFTALLGLCGVLLLGEALTWLITGANVIEGGPALIARLSLQSAVGPKSSVQPIYVFFVLLPVSLAVLAIGIPFFLRTLLAAVHRTLDASEALGLAAFLVTTGVFAFEALAGRNGLVAVGTAALIGVWQSWNVLAAPGRRIGSRLLGVSGLGLAGFGYYQYRLVQGGGGSLAVAPTLLVLGFFAGCTGLLFVLARALGGAGYAGSGRITACAALVGAAAWCSAPYLRALAGDGASADGLELRVAAFGAVVFIVVAIARELRRAEEPRGGIAGRRGAVSIA